MSQAEATLWSIMEISYGGAIPTQLERKQKRMNLLAHITKGFTKEQASDLTKLFEEANNLTFEEIYKHPSSPFYFYPFGSNIERGSSQHSKKLYQLTRELTCFKNHLLERYCQPSWLASVEEVISLITCYREDTRELPFHWAKARFLAERYRGAKLLFPPGLSVAELRYTLPEIIHVESDDESDIVEGSMDPNISRLDTEKLAASYLSCLESICKAVDDLSKEKIKRLSDIFKGLGGYSLPEGFTAGGELLKLKQVYGLTKKGLRSRLEEDMSQHLQSMTNSGNSSKSHKLSIPQIVGTVWEACSALKKIPGTNVTAIGRAMTQIAVSIKDVHREMQELKPTSEEAAKPDTEASKPDQDSDNSSEDELGSDLSPEEMKIAELSTEVVSCTLTTIKEVIRSISGLLKNPQTQNESNQTVDSLEKLLAICQNMGLQVDEIGACLYPPQEVSAIRTVSEKMLSLVGEMQAELDNIKGSSDAFIHSSKGLISSLEQLESLLGCSSDDELVNEMENLAVDA